MDIICSIGPNVKDIVDIDDFVSAGMTIPRFNFSHVDYEKFEELVKGIREKYPEMKIMQDLQGNKLRISKQYIGENKINPKQEVIFCLEDSYKNILTNNYSNKNRIIPISYTGVLEDFRDVEDIYMKDTTMIFKIIDKHLKYFKAETVRGGILRAEKGINAPGLNRKELKLTEKDKKDIEIGIINNIDIISLSYVTSSRDIKELKEYIKSIIKKYEDKKMPKIWAKVECREALGNFDDILKVSDGIVLGRGDLKSEIPIEEFPYEEEKVIVRMKKSSKKLIVATHILESMVRESIPRISEVNDIYKYIKNKVDGLMLSTEVAISRDPINVIAFLEKLYERYV